MSILIWIGNKNKSQQNPNGFLYRLWLYSGCHRRNRRRQCAQSPQALTVIPERGPRFRLGTVRPCGLFYFRAVLRTTVGAASGAARKETATRHAARQRGRSVCDSGGLALRRSPGTQEGNHGLSIDEPARVVKPFLSLLTQRGRGRLSGEFPAVRTLANPQGRCRYG